MTLYKSQSEIDPLLCRGIHRGISKYVSESLGPEGWAQARGGEGAGLADLSMANNRRQVIHRAQKGLPAPRGRMGTGRRAASAPWRGCQAHRGGVTPGATVTAQSRA